MSSACLFWKMCTKCSLITVTNRLQSFFVKQQYGNCISSNFKCNLAFGSLLCYANSKVTCAHVNFCQIQADNFWRFLPQKMRPFHIDWFLAIEKWIHVHENRLDRVVGSQICRKLSYEYRSLTYCMTWMSPRSCSTTTHRYKWLLLLPSCSTKNVCVGQTIKMTVGDFFQFVQSLFQKEAFSGRACKRTVRLLFSKSTATWTLVWCNVRSFKQSFSRALDGSVKSLLLVEGLNLLWWPIGWSTFQKVNWSIGKMGPTVTLCLK